MPLYDYACITCDRTATVSQPITSKLTTPICVGCGYRMVRSFGVSGVNFRGDGWASKEK